jgi:hypothetical protein
MSICSDAGMQSESVSSWKPKVQVPAGYYDHADYDDWDKWTTYYWTIRNVTGRRLKDVLEIGIGSRVVSFYLRNNGVSLTTLDIDPALQPDKVGSVTELPFMDASFDGIVCTEVLEHMPFEESQKAICELYRVTRRHVFVTVPHFTLSFAMLIRVPMLGLREIRMRIPCPKRLKPNGQHFWECGRPGYPVKRLRRAFTEAGFAVVSETRQPTQFSSCFFVLEKK